MAQLDRLMSALFSHPGAELHLLTGEEPRLHVGRTDRVLVPRKLHVNQVRFLIGEILDDAARVMLENVGWLDFVYTPPGLSPVSVSVGAWHDEDTWARVRPEPRAAMLPSVPRAAPVRASLPMPLEPAPSPRTAAPLAPLEFVPPEKASLSNASLTLDGLLEHLVREKASDLHLSSGQLPMMRRHGSMEHIAPLEPLTAEALMQLIAQALPRRNREQFMEDNDTDFAYELPGVSRFRINLFRDRFGPGIVARVIPTEILSADDLALPQAVRNLCYLSKGLVLVTGPTGSGKSTTLAALIDLINRERDDHIITLEDPIEFVHPSKKCLVNQREVGVHTTGFKRALRAALREDPDVILVGEMRDLETIAIAIETAETGHLVFGTLHTTTAASTVDRVIDQFPAGQKEQVRVMLSESLKGVVSQTLCKKIGGGRAAALEVLISTPAVANLIREGKTFQIPSVMQTSRKLGMTLLNDALLQLVQAKKIEPREAYLRAIDKTGMLTAMHAAGVSPDNEANG